MQLWIFEEILTTRSSVLRSFWIPQNLPSHWKAFVVGRLCLLTPDPMNREQSSFTMRPTEFLSTTYSEYYYKTCLRDRLVGGKESIVTSCCRRLQSVLLYYVEAECMARSNQDWLKNVLPFIDCLYKNSKSHQRRDAKHVVGSSTKFTFICKNTVAKTVLTLLGTNCEHELRATEFIFSL